MSLVGELPERLVDILQTLLQLRLGRGIGVRIGRGVEIVEAGCLMRSDLAQGVLIEHMVRDREQIGLRVAILSGRSTRNSRM